VQVSAYLDGPCVTIARLPSAHWIITGGFWDGAVLATAAAPGVATKLLLTKRNTEPSHTSCPVTAIDADGANLAIGDAGGVLRCGNETQLPQREARNLTTHQVLHVLPKAMGQCLLTARSTFAWVAACAT